MKQPDDIDELLEDVKQTMSKFLLNDILENKRVNSEDLLKIFCEEMSILNVDHETISHILSYQSRVIPIKKKDITPNYLVNVQDTKFKWGTQ